jgi:lipopolysaccharide export system protein LptC
MLRTALPWLALLVIALVGLSLLDQPAPRLISNIQVARSEFPHAFMENIETLEFDAQGHLRYRMNTPSGRYFQKDPEKPGNEDYSLVDQPQVVFYPANSTAPWQLRAELGYVRADGQHLRLDQGVEAEQASPSQGLIQVETESLSIHPTRQYAETDKAVKMRAQLGQLETLGMRAYLSEDRIELLSNVKGTYAP